MKKYLFAALFAAVFSVPAFSQTDAEEDSMMVVVDENYIPEISSNERAEIHELLVSASAQRIVYDDDCGSLIFKNEAGKYGYINIRTSKKLLFTEQDFIEIVDITGCGLADGVIVQKGGKIEVCSPKGDIIIPSVEADAIIEVMRNPFKTTQNYIWGYAIFKRGSEFFATNTAGTVKNLDVEKCEFGVNMIFASKGDDIYVYTPDTSEKPEFVFNLKDKGVEYTEVEVLETQGQGRYDYDGKKYNNITPGVVVKKGMSYTLYPGAQKLTVHKSGSMLIGKAGSKKVVFSPFFDEPESVETLLNPL